MTTSDRAATEKPRGTESDKLLYCSFCGKSQHEIFKLLGGPSAFICDECVQLCNGVLKKEGKKQGPSGAFGVGLPDAGGSLGGRLRQWAQSLSGANAEIILWTFLGTIVVLQIAAIVLLTLK